MTREEFTRNLPKLTNNPLPMKPPFVFNGLSARIFPLRANLDTLQQLCNGYLNLVPPEAGYFRATLPYVYLAVLDYGEMAEAVMRTGWFAQTEVFFSVPVEWYKRVNGQWVFHDWAVITPYIFVDDDFSAPLGRIVFGFPKILARTAQVGSNWMKNPVAPVTLARIETAVFPEAYSGKGIETRVFLEIQRAAAPNLQVPFDTASPMTPWTMASNMANAIGGFSRDALWMAQAMRIFPVNPAASPWLLQEMLARMAPASAPGGAGFIQNSINLKQFRRADEPSQICFQALTNGGMQTRSFNGGGLLGQERILLGDLSGGHSVRLYEHSSLPIARTLGLEVHRQWKNDDISVAEIKPVMPFWIDVDLQYYPGSNIAWRTDDGIWKDAAGTPFDPKQRPAEERKGPDFNSAVTTAIEAIAGPFQFTGTTVRVIPLLADKKKLQEFLKTYLNDPLQSPIVREDGTAAERVEFEVWARPSQSINTGTPIGGNFAYVYLTASSFTNVTSKTDNVGDWAKYELAFMIPVKWKRMDAHGNWIVAGVGVVPAFTFVDDCIAAMSRFEVQGIDARTAQFVRPESVWLSEEGELDPKQTLLRVEAEVFPAMGVGQKATMQPVIEISRGDPDAGLGEDPDRPWRRAEDLVHELGEKKGTKLQYWKEMKIARALALELLGNQTPVALYTLKQFRDVTDPDKACYQSLVRVPRVLSEVFDVREIEDTLAVRIHDYPSLNIVEELGIQAARLKDNSAGILYSAQGIRPFFIRATVDEPLAERLLSRAGTLQWTLHAKAFDTLLSDETSGEGEKGAPRITVDMKAEKLQDEMDPSRTAATMFQARERWKAKGREPWEFITSEMARRALAVADPQIVIESMLSREWSNNDPNARWRKGQNDLLKAFSSLPEGGETKPFAEAELYRRINNMLAAAPGTVAAAISWEQTPKAANGKGTAGQPDSKKDFRSWFRTIWEEYQQLPLREICENRNGHGTPGRWPEEVERIVETDVWLGVLLARIRQLYEREPGGKEVWERYQWISFRELYENLTGHGAARRWRDEMKDIIVNQREFTAQRLIMEHSVDVLSSVAILGLTGVQEAYAALNRKLPSDRQLDVPSARKLVDAGVKLMTSMKAIQAMKIIGEPSPHNNLDVVALADSIRLGELLTVLQAEIHDEMRGSASPDAELEVARSHGEEFRQVVDLTRRYCNVQYEALLSKLSRAYQKPDFCVRRDAVGSDRDRLLPMTLSWDPDWYYGDNINLLDPHGTALGLVGKTGTLGETPPSPTESPQAAGS